MPASPEREILDGIREVPSEFPEIPAAVEQGITTVKKNFTGQVKSGGKPLIQTPPAQVFTIQPPADSVTLTSQSKGSTTSSLTWFAAFWLRMIKKALHFGWKILGK